MVSLYGQYIAERRGQGIIETDYGFISFDYPTQDIVFIVDMYIVPEKRESGLGNELVYAMCREAVKSGHTQLVSGVDLSAPGAERNCKIAEKQGAKMFKVVEPMAYYVMEIKDLPYQETVIEDEAI